MDPDGNEVIVHAVIGDPASPTRPSTRAAPCSPRSYPGTLADRVAVPRRNLVPKPAQLSFAQAACLPTAWLTAYRMLAVRGRVAAGDAVLVQGAGGGVATAAVVLARALGARVYATSRDAGKRERVAALGATAVEPDGKLPERVDVVIETVGGPTMEHSVRSAKPGGRIVVCGSTGGRYATVDLTRLFFLQLELLGSTMGTRDELAALVRLCVDTGVRPVIDSVYPFAQARTALHRLVAGDVFGKIVLDHTG